MVACCPWCGAEYSVSDARCWDCRLALADAPEPSLPEGDDEEEVGFELDEWPAGDRGRLTASLRERGIPFRWEPGLAVVVGVADEEVVDALLDELDEWSEGGWSDGDAGDAGDPDAGDGGEVAHAAMGELFVASDRLMHAPDDGRAAADAVAAGAAVLGSPPPFGIEPAVWGHICELAGALVGDIEGGGEGAVAVGARALRDALRPYV